MPFSDFTLSTELSAKMLALLGGAALATEVAEVHWRDLAIIDPALTAVDAIFSHRQAMAGIAYTSNSRYPLYRIEVMIAWPTALGLEPNAALRTVLLSLMTPEWWLVAPATQTKELEREQAPEYTVERVGRVVVLDFRATLRCIAL